MVLKIWDVVRIDKDGETGIVIGHRIDGRIAVGIKDGRTRLISPLGLTRQLNG